MTARETKLVQWAIAQTRHELGDRVAPGSPDVQWSFGPDGVKAADVKAIRRLARRYTRPA